MLLLIVHCTIYEEIRRQLNEGKLHATSSVFVIGFLVEYHESIIMQVIKEVLQKDEVLSALLLKTCIKL